MTARDYMYLAIIIVFATIATIGCIVYGLCHLKSKTEKARAERQKLIKKRLNKMTVGMLSDYKSDDND